CCRSRMRITTSTVRGRGMQCKGFCLLVQRAYPSFSSEHTTTTKARANTRGSSYRVSSDIDCSVAFMDRVQLPEHRHSTLRAIQGMRPLALARNKTLGIKRAAARRKTGALTKALQVLDIGCRLKPARRPRRDKGSYTRSADRDTTDDTTPAPH